MKRLLLIGLILAICVLAFPQGVMAATDPTAIINAQITGVPLEFAVTEPTGMWTLVRGANTLGTTDTTKIKIEVNSSMYWTVSAEAASTAHKGHMISKTTPFEWLNKELYTQTASADAKLDGIAVAVGNGNPGAYADTVFYRTLNQEVLTLDKAKADYTITLTYTVAES